ncbi:MAG: hypothetical protein HC927_00220 [Deltaproteobacteria bacterium]|nr:hypothetical protein [Deltaproteobacteria bacterium]
MLLIDEVRSHGEALHVTRRNAYDRLKEVVSPAQGQLMPVNAKYVPETMTVNCFTVFLLTNHTDALAIPEDDRRIAVLSTGKVPQKSWDHAIHAWAENPQNIGALARALAERYQAAPSEQRYPAMSRRLPDTAARALMVRESRSPLSLAAEAFSDACPTFCWRYEQYLRWVVEVYNRQQPDQAVSRRALEGPKAVVGAARPFFGESILCYDGTRQIRLFFKDPENTRTAVERKAALQQLDTWLSTQAAEYAANGGF